MTQLVDVTKGLTQPQVQQVKVFFTSCMWELAKSLRLRSRVAASAITYFRKFYSRKNFCEWDPQLVHVGCLYLASKTEESSVAASLLVGCVKRLLPAWPYDICHVLDVEMVILQSLDFWLALLNPFQPLVALATDACVPQHVTHRAWSVLNDAFFCDAPVLYPPQLLALGCLVYSYSMDQEGEGTKQLGLLDHEQPQVQQEVQAHHQPQRQQQQQLQQGPQPAQQEQAHNQNQPQQQRTQQIRPLQQQQQQQSMSEGGKDSAAFTEPPMPFTAWLHGLEVDLSMVYGVVEELALMYDTAHKRLSAEECVRLLAAIGSKADCSC